MRVALLCALLLSVHASVTAQDQSATREIQHLMNYLATSACEFNRNGKWYDAAQAVKHLQRKYDYLRKRNLAPTAETFIERAASESNSSKQAYRVKCPGQPEVNSADWFNAELTRIRVPRE